MKKASSPVETFGVAFHRSFTFRVFVVFVVLWVLLAAGFGAGVFYLLNKSYHETNTFRMDQMVEFYMERRAGGELPLNDCEPFLKVYDNIEDVPDINREVIRNLADGAYESNDDDDGVGGPRNYSYHIRTLPNGSGRLYVVLEEDEQDIEDKYKRKMKRNVLYAFIMAVFLSFFGAFLCARMLTHPLQKLLDKVRGSNPRSLPVGFSEEYAEDEVGVLARALDETNQRICAFIEREKQFTRDASHELRTPLTVLKGAMAVIDRLPSETRHPLSNPLARIERATSEMEYYVENLLQRSKGEAAQERTTFEALPLVSRIVEESRYLVEGKKVTLSLSATADPVLVIAESEFIMAASNLIRNACHYTHEGQITVYLTETHLEVLDTGPGISEKIIHRITEPYVKGDTSKGHGIGLAIVKRVCDEAGWQLSIKNANPGTRIRITFLKK